MTGPLKIFVGWDSKEPLAWVVLAHSILRRASVPVSIIPLTRASLRHVYTRPRGPTEATEFSMTRFLVPYLSNYEGISIFCDSDMLCLADIGDVMLYPLANPDKAVHVCQHDYVPKALTKFDGHEQTKYPRKNWSSFMVFDNAKCKALTPELVNVASGLTLHRFLWTTDDLIGSLPLDWNWLVGEYEPKPDAQVLHYTNGAPCFPGFEKCDHADLWWAEYRDMLKPARAVEFAIERAFARGGVAEALDVWREALIKSQKALPPDARKVLHDNLWTLYDGEPMVALNPNEQRLARVRETLRPTRIGYCAEPLDIDDARWLLDLVDEHCLASGAPTESDHKTPLGHFKGTVNDVR